jgi:4-amino-4-deoxy-L-arabinose transferase-like glycosyltransferase
MRLEKRHNVALGALIALALLLRLAYVLANPQPAIRGDALHYDDIASNLAAGHGFSMSSVNLLPADRPPDGGPGPTARRPPLYPVFLAIVYRVAGHGYGAVLILQALIGALTCWIIYALCRATLRDRTAALVALAMAAVYPPFVRYCGDLLTETLFLFLTVAAFLAAWRAMTAGGAARTALAGALGGLAALCRPTAVFFLPLEGLLLIAAVSGPGRARSWSAHMAVYATAFCLVLSPWVIRNYAVFDSFIPGFTSAGYNLFMGTYPESHGLANVNPSAHPEQLRARLKGVGEVRADAIYRRAALRNVETHPFEYLKLVGMKTLRGWFVIKPGHEWTPTPLSLAGHGALLVLAFIGALWNRKRHLFGVIVLASGAAAFTGFHALVVSNLRYNLPAVPFAMILASAALAAIASRALSPRGN